MSRRSRKKTAARAAKAPATAKPDTGSGGNFALSMAFAMQKSQPDDDTGNAVARNRNERLQALASSMGQRGRN